MRQLSVTGVATCIAPCPTRTGTMRLETAGGQVLFLLTHPTENLEILSGHVVRVTGRVLGREIGAEAPLLEITEARVLAPASLLYGGVEPFSPAILRAEVPRTTVIAWDPTA